MHTSTRIRAYALVRAPCRRPVHTSATHARAPRPPLVCYTQASPTPARCTQAPFAHTPLARPRARTLYILYAFCIRFMHTSHISILIWRIRIIYTDIQIQQLAGNMVIPPITSSFIIFSFFFQQLKILLNNIKKG